jgi:tetratricopeptide (TPR) repeat protein
VTPRPLIFVSAVSRELRGARQLVANTLTFLGYQPIWQEIFGTESGDLREILRQQIDQCKGVVQLVGQCYGAEPPTSDEQFGRVSYTQYEALYARRRGKKVWYLFIDEGFPTEPCENEPEELRKLQASYRSHLQSDTHIFHPLSSSDALEASVLKLRDDLARLRRGVKQWAIGVAALLIIILVLAIWQVRGQAAVRAELAKLRQAIVGYPQVEAQMRASQGDKEQPPSQEQVFAALGKQLGIDPNILSQKLPALADQLRHASSASSYDRANAAYVAKDYAEAERLAVDAAKQSHDQAKQSDSIKALKLAGFSAQKQTAYSRAMQHFREAEALTDRGRDPEEWAELQAALASGSTDQGRYIEAENILRKVVEVRTRILGADHPDTLRSRQNLAVALWRRGRYAEAEADFHEIIEREQKVFGPEHPDTLLSRNNLGLILLGQGKYTEAENQYRDLIKAYEKVLGPEHPDTLRSRHNLTFALNGQGRYAESERQCRELIRLYEKVLGPEHPETLLTRINLGKALLEQGKYAAAEQEYRELIKLQTKVLGAEHPDTLLARNNLGVTLLRQGRYAEAEGQYLELDKTYEKALGPDHLDTLRSRSNLADALSGQGKHAEAETQFRHVIQIYEKILGPEHPDTLDSCFHFASGLRSQSKFEEAKKFARRAAEGARKSLGPEHPSTKKYERLLADLDGKR